VASNLKRSKRTVGKKINDLDRRVSRLQRNPPARRIGQGVIAASNIAQNAVSYPQLNPTVVTNISGAQATADGKNTIFYTASVPVANKAGDIWFDTDDDYKLYRALSAGADAIGAGEWEQAVVNASNLTVGELDANRVLVSNLDAGRITVGTLSGREVVCQQTVFAIPGVPDFRTITKAQLLANGAIFAEYDHAGESGVTFFTRVYINRSELGDGGDGIALVGNATGTTLTTNIRPSQIRTPDLVETSDARLKENVESLLTSNAIDIVKNLRPVTYNYIGSSKSSHGFIAQEVHEVCEDFVNVGGEDPATNPWGISYTSVIPALTSALQDCMAKIDDLETRLAALEN
jgi:hypothetical protein